MVPASTLVLPIRMNGDPSRKVTVAVENRKPSSPGTKTHISATCVMLSPKAQVGTRHATKLLPSLLGE